MEYDIFDDNVEIKKESDSFDYKKLFYLVTSISITLTSIICFLLLFPQTRSVLNKQYFSDNEMIISLEEANYILNSYYLDLKSLDKDIYLEEYILLNAIRTNDNLTLKEKELFYQVIDILKDNTYINKEYVYFSLNNVYVEYLKRPKSVNSNVCADYNYIFKQIRMFLDEPDLNEDICGVYKKYLLHEIIHCIFVKNNTLPSYFSEGMTELLCNEYFSDDPYFEYNSYPLEICAVKILCEVTSTDTVLKSFTLEDMSFIEEEISNILGNSEEAKLCLNSLNKTFKQLEKNNVLKKEEYSDYYECIKIFRKCMQIKTSENKEYDDSAYLYNEVLLENLYIDPKSVYNEYFNQLENLACEKPYFSSKLKNGITDREWVKTKTILN